MNPLILFTTLVVFTIMPLSMKLVIGVLLMLHYLSLHE